MDGTVSRALMAVVVGVVTGLIVYVIGLVLIEVDVESVGNFVKNIAGLLGLLAGIFYFVTGRRAV